MADRVAAAAEVYTDLARAAFRAHHRRLGIPVAAWNKVMNLDRYELA